ncbi:ATP-binding protein [Psychromarinibacter sp. S121]|uniref:ATP-binding protein n=1 Tax=Psychromarinibacter sp. S121 TaxID=3415127 RepID=UPI003C7D6AE6
MDVALPAARADTRRLAAICASAVIVITLVVLVVGWGMGNSIVVRLHPTFPAMVPGTAVSLLLLAVAQLLVLRPTEPAARTARMLQIAVAGFALVKLALHFEEHARLPDVADRMAFATLIGLPLVAASGLCATASNAAWRRHATILASAGVVMCTIALVGYLFDPAAVRGIAVFLGLAIPTAFSLLLLFTAVLLFNASGSWVSALTSDGAPSEAARAALPLAVAAPILLCYLALLSTEVGIINPNVRLSTLAVLLAALSVAVVVRTARFNAEAQQRSADEQARLTRIFDGLAASVFVVDDKGTVLLTNDAARKMAGKGVVAEDWLRSAPFHTLDDRSALEGDLHPVRQALDARGGPELFAGWFGPGGSEHALRFSATRLPADGVTLIAVSDETQSWMLRETLGRTERLDAIGQLSGGISHELANILGVIRLSSDTALLGDNVDGMRRQLEAVRKACSRGADLTERLLHLSREPSYSETAVDAAEIARSAVLLASGSMADRVELVAKLDDVPPCPVAVSGGDLESAVLNLILNARNAVEEGGAPGRIEIEVSAGADEVAIIVRDTGVGMSHDIQRKAREPFYTTRRAKGGSGLGLSMVDNLARRVGGRLDIRSAPGEGTEIKMVLPRSGEAQASEQDKDADTLAGLTGIRVLLVEDDQSFAEAMVGTLELLGVVPWVAQDASQALKMLEDRGAPDILLTDIALPGGIYGDQLAVEAVARHPELRVIFMSGNAALLNQADREVPGIRLRKPVSLKGLANAIRLTMSGRLDPH